MEKLNEQEINNLIALVNLAPIKGLESITVALLLQKLEKMKNELKNSDALVIGEPVKS